MNQKYKCLNASCKNDCKVKLSWGMDFNFCSQLAAISELFVLENVDWDHFFHILNFLTYLKIFSKGIQQRWHNNKTILFFFV
tara:strand:- start:806 stop:1051 length:246 start_codon:yes stop_codon:yes gene_type:complete